MSNVAIPYVIFMTEVDRLKILVRSCLFAINETLGFEQPLIRRFRGAWA